MPNRHVLTFRSASPLVPSQEPALSPEIAASVERSIARLPLLAMTNPDAALLIERSINDWLPHRIEPSAMVRAKLRAGRKLKGGTCVG
jgi:hypothetical protein